MPPSASSLRTRRRRAATAANAAVLAAATVAAISATVPLGVVADCGDSYSSCGGSCYDPSFYSCVNDGMLCPAGYSICGIACFDPASYYCSDGSLFQGTDPSGGGSSDSSGSSSSDETAAPADDTTTAADTTAAADDTSTGSGATDTGSTATAATGAYSLVDDFSGSNFFGGFDFFTDSDPTHGYVTYVDQATAQSDGLIAAGNPTTISVDTTNTYPSAGRASVRLTSNKSYNSGTVFVVDLAHMPFGCGTWPAVWLVGPNWPSGGEIDIVEGVNVNANNQMTLHTSPGCTIDTSSQSQTGTNVATDCDATANGNAGCGITDPSASSYGDGFNNGGGGVFAVEWTSSSIKIWRFDRSSIPSDISGGSGVSPDGWGTPAAHWPLGSSCPASFFSNMQIVIDDTFCGDWAGNVFGSGCSGSGMDACNNFVAYQPSSFTDAYWSFNYIRTFA